jgi:glyoxylase-like metal-dependent hydrolase (beta-lactamase superfamily II)
MKLVLLMMGALGLGAFATSTPQDGPEFKLIPAAGQVSMLTGAGGNIGVMVGDDGILMIDTQFAQYEKPIRETIAKIAEGAPQYVVNTHWHGDHVGGNLAFGAEGVLVAHEKVRSRMKKGAGERKPAMPKELPVITYTDGLTIHWNDEDVRLVHFPLGHTDGDTVVFFSDSKVVHLGDLMFNGMFPFIDLESGGDVRGYYQTSQSLTAMLGDDIKIIPGHGKLATLKDLQAQAEMLRECIEIMELRIANGLSEEDAVEAGLPQKYASWSWSFIPTEKWLATLYKGLKSKDS